MAAKCSALAMITSMWKISWYPNTVGLGSGHLMAYMSPPMLYESPPATSSHGPSGPRLSATCKGQSLTTQPRSALSFSCQPHGHAFSLLIPQVPSYEFARSQQPVVFRRWGNRPLVSTRQCQECPCEGLSCDGCCIPTAGCGLSSIAASWRTSVAWGTMTQPRAM